MPTRELVLDGIRDGIWSAVWPAAGVVAAVCLVLLFRYERRLIPPRLGMVLLTLRLAAIGLLVLALLEPRWRITHQEEHRGRIVVAADVSLSMATSDKSLSPAETLRLARALGMIGNAATDAELDEWIAASDQVHVPEQAQPNETQNDGDDEMRADARRQLVAALRRELVTLPRTEIVRRLLTHGPVTLLDQLRNVGPVERRLFAANSTEATADSFDALLANPSEISDREKSDLAQPLKGDGAAEPVAAVILLTDGRDSVHRDAAPVVAAARSLGAPVFPVLIGSEERPKDLAITSVAAPSAVFLNDHPVVRVGLRTSGFRGHPVEVSLVSEDDGAGSAPEMQTITPQGDTAETQFMLNADALGRRRYSVKVAPQSGETRDDNNERRFAIQVVNDKAHVLLLDGDARWEFRYLVAALQRDPRVQLESVLFDQPYLGLLPQTFFPRELKPLGAAGDGTETALAEYDAILIGDVDPQRLPPQTLAAIENYVRTDGGTLVLMAGKQHMPAGYAGGPLEGLLPVENLRAIGADAADALRPPGSRGFRLQITPDGEAEGALALDPDAAKNQRIWKLLPGHTWGLLGRAKPGSTVWATGVRPDEQPDLAAERAAAVIVAQSLGAGRVVWIGIDSTWRWRSHVGDLFHHRFWGQLVRQAAEFKAAAHNDAVQFGPDRPQIEVGDPATFRARWTDRFLQQHPELKSHVELWRVDGGDEDPALSAVMTPKSDRPNEFEARVAGLKTGEYRAQLVIDDAAADTDPVTAELAVVEKASPELNDLTANRALLQQIAAASSGELLLPDQLHDLPDRLRGGSTSESIQRTIPLWNHWGMLVLFCALVGAEWLLRKLNGLP